MVWHEIVSASQRKVRALVEALLHPSAYPHPVTKIELLETHISWVILTGFFAYKIKKPIKLDFLDFSTLERRRFYCHEELRLNKRWAPEVYLDVVPICGSHKAPTIGGVGDAIEYAVKMLQFPQSARLDAQLDAGLLSETDMDELAETVAENHNSAEAYENSISGDAIGYARQPMFENFELLRSHTHRCGLKRIENWTESNLHNLRKELRDRHQRGFVRECHGDLHLENIVRLPSGIAAFDCLEFNSELRRIDVISDIAFLAMDLIARGRQDLAYLFVNRYLECTGDYSGMAVFGLYFVYHCMIRAKVAAIRGAERTEAVDRQRDLEEMAHYCAVAHRWIVRRRAKMIAMHGYSGSGKTWLSQRLMAQLPAIRVRSDVERKRIHGLSETHCSKTAPGQGIYSDRMQTGMYKLLLEIAEALLKSGESVIVDAAFLRREDRRVAAELADRLGVDIVMIDATASKAELVRRLHQRQRIAVDASEADVAVLEYQLANADPLLAEDFQRVPTISVDSATDCGDLVSQISALKTHHQPPIRIARHTHNNLHNTFGC